VASDSILYLSERQVARALEEIDAVDAIASALAAHARGETTLPAEAHLGWDWHGEALRSLSMPAVIGSSAGVKVINANPSNPARRLPRASGLTILFSTETARPICIMEGARISCVRTAAVTAVAAEQLGSHPVERLAIIGAGALALCHLHLLIRRLRELREIRVYDVRPRRAAILAGRWRADGPRVGVCGSPERAIREADVIVPVTTTTSGYIRHEWLKPGALLVNVSLDDPLPEVVLRADKVFVDDWQLVATDERRLLGRMLREGMIRGPDEDAGRSPSAARPVDGELGQLLVGVREGRAHADEVILVNPFGLAIEDLAVAQEVYERATRLGLGVQLER
jgi:ornithine cyclodeaminase